VLVIQLENCSQSAMLSFYFAMSTGTKELASNFIMEDSPVNTSFAGIKLERRRLVEGSLTLGGFVGRRKRPPGFRGGRLCKKRRTL
jgi:hypothetical protein